MRKYYFISWGGGVQSTAMAVMSVLGDLPEVDAIIMADTGWERTKTVESVEVYTRWLRRRGGVVKIVSADSNINVGGYAVHKHMPLWTVGGGPLKRQCTREYKLVPIKHSIRQIMGYKPSLPPNPPASIAEVWLGITWDEMERMKKSRIKYMVNRWPLLEKRMTRTDCKDYLRDRGLPVPVKSACVGCPYRNASTWAEIKNEENGDFLSAVAFDEKLREAKLQCLNSNELYLYRTRVPLSDVDFVVEARKERKAKQLPMFCDGLCGV